METIRVLLIDTTDEVKDLFEKQLALMGTFKLIVHRVVPKSVKGLLNNGHEPSDVILFGEKIGAPAVLQLAKSLRSRGLTVPILQLTRQSEAQVPRTLLRAGVDDVLNIREIDTPLFSWTFMSTMKQAEIRKKAEEFDVIRHRMQDLNESLATITHEINNPLGVLRLALYHLGNPDLAAEKREKYYQLLVDNVDRLDVQVRQIRNLREQLGEDTTVLTKVLSAKMEEEDPVSH